MLDKFFNLPKTFGNLSKEKLLIILFFSIIFIAGVNSVKDYGTTNDEYSNRFRSLVTLNYLGEKFLPEINKKYKGNKQVPTFNEYKDKNKFYGGDVIQVPLTLAEILLKIDDKKNAFVFRHYIYYIIFFISLIVFYKILKVRFQDWRYCLLGVLILFLSPRIFANSIYNNFDIPFMAFSIFAVNYGLKLLKKFSIKRIFIFSLFCAMSINIRIMGLVIPSLFCLAIFLQAFEIKKEFKRYITTILCIILLTFLLYILFFPSLWESPFLNTWAVFTNLANHQMGGLHLYFGKLISFYNAPWHYIPVWIFITTPLLYSILFIFGLFDFLKKTFMLKKNFFFLIDMIFFLLIFIPIIADINCLYMMVGDSYFIYPFIIIYSIKSFIYISTSKSKILRSFSILTVSYCKLAFD